MTSQTYVGAGGRNFALSGYGIADFIWLAIKVEGNESKTNHMSLKDASYLTAFEMKLRDWKRALQQAYRYSYFADEAIVVLPPKSAALAKQNIDLFKTLEIGLWSFDADAYEIQQLYNPANRHAKNLAAKEKALSLIRDRVDLC